MSKKGNAKKPIKKKKEIKKKLFLDRQYPNWATIPKQIISPPTNSMYGFFPYMLYIYMYYNDINSLCSN